MITTAVARDRRPGTRSGAGRAVVRDAQWCGRRDNQRTIPGVLTDLLARAYPAWSLGLRYGGSTGCSRAAGVGCARCGVRPRVRDGRPGDPAVLVRRLPVQRGPAAGQAARTATPGHRHG